MQITAQISQVCWAVPPGYSGKNSCLRPHCCCSDTEMNLLDFPFFSFYFFPFLFFFFIPGGVLLKVFFTESL